jgi:hypothetical protein
MTRIQTYSERLSGFVNLTQSTAMYSPFGLSADDLNSPLTYNHDAFSYVLTHFGVIPTGVLLAVLLFGLRLAHRRVFSMPKNEIRQVATVAISLVLATLATAVLFGGSYYTVFPQNLLLWLLVGVAVTLLTGSFAPRTSAEESGESEDDSLPGVWRPRREGVALASSGTRVPILPPGRQRGRFS